MQVTRRDFLKIFTTVAVATMLPLPRLTPVAHAKPVTQSAWKANKEWGGDTARARGPFTFDTGGQII